MLDIFPGDALLGLSCSPLQLLLLLGTIYLQSSASEINAQLNWSGDWLGCMLRIMMKYCPISFDAFGLSRQDVPEYFGIHAVAAISSDIINEHKFQLQPYMTK